MNADPLQRAEPPPTRKNTNITIGFLVLMAILLAINLSGTYVTHWSSDISVGKVLALAPVVAIEAAIGVVTLHRSRRVDPAPVRPPRWRPYSGTRR